MEKITKADALEYLSIVLNSPNIPSKELGYVSHELTNLFLSNFDMKLSDFCFTDEIMFNKKVTSKIEILSRFFKKNSERWDKLCKYYSYEICLYLTKNTINDFSELEEVFNKTQTEFDDPEKTLLAILNGTKVFVKKCHINTTYPNTSLTAKLAKHILIYSSLKKIDENNLEKEKEALLNFSDRSQFDSDLVFELINLHGIEFCRKLIDRYIVLTSKANKYEFPLVVSQEEREILELAFLSYLGDKEVFMTKAICFLSSAHDNIVNNKINIGFFIEKILGKIIRYSLFLNKDQFLEILNKLIEISLTKSYPKCNGHNGNTPEYLTFTCMMIMSIVQSIKS